MELDAPDRMLAMTYRVDFAGIVLGHGGYQQRVRQAFWLGNQRVVPHHLERGLETREEIRTVVEDARRLTVHDPAGPNDPPAVRFDDSLMPEAHAEDGYGRTQLPDEWDRDTGFGWRAWSG